MHTITIIFRDGRLPLNLQPLNLQRRTSNAPLKLLIVLLTLLILLLIYTPAVAQIEHQPQAAKIFEGQLTKIDLDARTVVVKGMDGVDMEFTYTDETQILLSPDKKAEGLVGKIGEQLRITYNDLAGKYIATRIEVGQKNA